MEQSKGKIIAIRIWLIISTILSVLFIAICIIGGVQSARRKQQSSEGIDQLDNSIIAYNLNNDINHSRIINPSFKAVSYDDTLYKISLDLNEVSDYTFENFAYVLDEYYSDNSSMPLSDITYDSVTYEADDFLSSEFYSWLYADDYIRLSNGDFKWSFLSSGASESFIEGFTITFSSIDYSYFKDAIELDIAANSQTFNDGIFETLSESVVDFIGSLSAGITSVIAVFYSNNALTVIGTLSVIVVAITLGYFLFRLIFGLIRMRG